VKIFFTGVGNAVEYIKTARLRALAVSTATRSEVLPDVPSMSDFVPAYEAIDWYGLGAPRNTPTEIVEKLNQEINGALADVKVKTQLGELGTMVLMGSPADFRKFIPDETEKWAKVIKFAKIKPE
jgi:tripartite-type tricarboxylate transporter receptor subunit TctC